jgi:PAS domain S-box-containing protein
MSAKMPQEKERWSFSFFKAFIFSIIGLIALLFILRRFASLSFTDVDIVLLILIFLLLGLLFIGKRGYLTLSGILLVLMMWIGSTYIMWTGQGVYDAVMIAYLALILIASLLLDWKVASLFLFATFLSIWLNTYCQMKGYLIPEPRDPLIIYTRDVTIIMLTVALISQFFLRQLNDNLKRLSDELYERKRIERALRASEENFRVLFEQAAEGINISDFSGEILLANESFSKMTGYSKDELEGKNISILFEPEELEKNPVRYDLVDKGEIVMRKRTLLKKNGKSIQVESRTKKMADGRLQSFITDISERTKAEKTLKDFERIFNLSANPICINYLDGTLIKVNPAFSKSLGYSENEIEGKKLFDFMHPGDIEKTISYVREKIKVKADLLQFKNRYIAQNNSIVWFSWITQPIYEEKISFSFAHDITHLKQIENELIAAKDKAEESDRLKTAFLENMSHEIRTPMNGIIGFSEMFLDQGLTQYQRKHYAQIVINSGQKLLTILDDILDLSRLETGQIEITKEAVNINKQLDELYIFFLSKAVEKKLDFKVEKDLPDDNSFITTDRNRLYQVLSNLLVNAFKFTRDGHIHFGYRTEGNFLKFYVEDTGIGIDKAMHQKIFERFRQANIDITKNYGGSGLGLSISQKLVVLLGGKIGVESEPGKGSNFFFTLPYIPSDRESIPDSLGASKKEKTGRKGFTILVVEDDETNYEYLSELLLKMGYKVLRAADGINAIQIAEEHREVDLVLMDIKLHVMNGYDATKRIKLLRPKLPVIAVTAFAMSADREKALQAGCDDYIAKPVGTDALIRLIDHYVKKPV